MGDEVTKDGGQTDMHRCYHEDRMSTPEEDGAKATGSLHHLMQIHMNLQRRPQPIPLRKKQTAGRPASTLHLGTDFEPA